VLHNLDILGQYPEKLHDAIIEIMKTENKQNEKFRFSEEMESFLKEQLKEKRAIKRRM
jgi:hypothetical protein